MPFVTALQTNEIVCLRIFQWIHFNNSLFLAPPGPTPSVFKKQATTSNTGSSNSNIIDYFSVYRKNNDDSFELAPSKKESTDVNDAEFFDDFDDDDLMQAVSFYVPNKTQARVCQNKSANSAISNTPLHSNTSGNLKFGLFK